MKRVVKKNHKVTKGMPSAVVLSILIHAALFLLAGMLVVFTVVKKEEKKFTPPKAVERPKMKLKKPKVKIKKTSKPKPTTRIVTKINRASMPDIQLPEMSGMGGEGFGGAPGGFDMMPDLSEPTLFGANQSIGNDFVGTFYDFKRDRKGKDFLGVDRGGSGWRIAIRKFLERDWDTSVFSRCYRSSRKLYATNFVVPLTRSSVAPLAFGDADAVGSLWMVHYKGLLNCPATHTNGITFRFWGSADEFMMVRVDGEMVFAIGWPGTSESYLRSGLWDPSSSASRKYWLGDQKAEVGDWVTLKPGMPLNMEILIGDNGWATAFYLLVEEEGVEYERNSKGAPILPSFKTAELSDGLLDAIYKNLPEGAMVCLTNGLVFRDYDVSIKAVAANNESEKVEPAVPEDSGGNKVRTWTLTDGSTVEAEFVNIFAGKVVLKNAKGKTCKMPKERLSAEDIEYAELAKPPVLDINFLKNFRQVNFSGGFYDFRTWDRPSEQWGHCGFQIKQTGTGEYNHELHVEMFIVGKQSKRSKYILFDHQKTAFIPARQEQRFYEFHSDRKVVIALDEWMLWDVQHNFGEKYYGYLITVTDARGKVVAMKSSSKWLPGIVGNLRYLSVGNYFDKTGARTYPDRPPKRTYSQSF